MGRSAHLVITTETGDIFNIEIDASEPVEHVKALIEVEAGIMLAEQILLFNGVELHNNKRLEEYNVGDNDILLVVRKGQRAPPPQQQPTSHTVSQAPTPQAFLDHVRNNPDLLQQVLANNPPLGEAILSSNLPVIQRFLDHQAQAHRAQEAERQKRMRLMNLDPLSLEYQQALEEEIQMENVNENMEHAMEYTPESFGRVVMLYIDCKANNVPVKAFVDTGAQQTIMSVKCAERCGIMRLIDRRFSGIAKGVGTARIIGRVHMAPIQIGASFFPCSFTILEDQDMEFILGLDMLRRPQCTIDLNNNVLVIGSERTPFLAEKDIPSSFMKEEHEGEIHPPITTTSSSTPSASSPAPVSTSPPPSSTPTSPPSTTTPAPTATRAPTGGVAPTPTRAPTGGVAPAPISAPTGGAAPPSEEAIGQLMNLGATRQEAIALLRQYRGNVELAASHLFGGGF